jgi:molybdopterin-guanine dinucleotide biosynthesis protein A
MTTGDAALAPRDITGLVLAGGRGSRMGGVDKGLQPFGGTPLARHALARLRPQVGALAVNANRHLDQYLFMGEPVWPDADTLFAGPLAGLLAGLTRSRTPWLATVPCDSPRFPRDLVRRLAEAAIASDTPIAMAASSAGRGPVIEPVFCLVHTDLRDDLAEALAGGVRALREWAGHHSPALAVFDQPGDDPQAFANANTLEELAALERQAGAA